MYLRYISPFSPLRLGSLAPICVLPAADNSRSKALQNPLRYGIQTRAVSCLNQCDIGASIHYAVNGLPNPSDDGIPALSATGSFTVAVYFQPTIQSITATNGIVTLTWSALDGKSYRVQYKGDLNDARWSNLSPDVTAIGGSASMTNSPASAPTFYRIQVLN